MESGTVERAFRLAESGEYNSIPEIVSRLKKENCETVEAHLAGSFIKKQLQAIMRKAN